MKEKIEIVLYLQQKFAAEHSPGSETISPTEHSKKKSLKQ